MCVPIVGYYLVLREGELGLDRTKLVIISAETNGENVFARKKRNSK